MALHIKGADGFVLDEISALDRISRDPEDLARQTAGAMRRYSDDGADSTHKSSDIVVIGPAKLGTLVHRVHTSDQAPPWRFGVRALMANLSARGLLRSGTEPVDAYQTVGSIAL